MGQENIPKRGTFVSSGTKIATEREMKSIIQVRWRKYRFEKFSFKKDQMQQQDKSHGEE